ncbi:MAG TPA: hypothetical protein VMW66_04310 [Elusimicrobiales bacterium]|nr:hypothetical protein [Elusimicrobiales bacterium]
MRVILALLVLSFTMSLMSCRARQTIKHDPCPYDGAPGCGNKYGHHKVKNIKKMKHDPCPYDGAPGCGNKHKNKKGKYKYDDKETVIIIK